MTDMAGPGNVGRYREPQNRQRMMTHEDAGTIGQVRGVRGTVDATTLEFTTVAAIDPALIEPHNEYCLVDADSVAAGGQATVLFRGDAVEAEVNGAGTNIAAGDPLVATNTVPNRLVHPDSLAPATVRKVIARAREAATTDGVRIRVDFDGEAGYGQYVSP